MIKVFSKFRPCIDLHNGEVKQIVGGTLSDNQGELKTNFTSEKPSSWYAKLYAKNQASGGHIIKLGPGNDVAAQNALEAWPGHLQIGGGINPSNAQKWLDFGASHLIVTSFLFEKNQFSWSRLEEMVAITGKDRLVIDLSCRRVEEGWAVATNRWQTVTSTLITADLISKLEVYCAEFLIHAADVEGLQQGIDEDLIKFLSNCVSIPTTYAGGARNIDDLRLINELSSGKLDLTIGSALDVFGGEGCTFSECIDWNQGHLA